MRWRGDRMNDGVQGLGQGRRWGRHQGRPVPVLIGAAVVLIIGLLIYRASAPGEIQVRTAADAAAQQLERTPVSGVNVTADDVAKALADGTRDSRGRSATGINVRAAGSDDAAVC